MAHSLVVGMTMTGKSFLSKMIVKVLKEKYKLPVAVLDPLRDPDWGADFQSKDQSEFLNYVSTHKNHICVVDEAGTAIGKYDMSALALTTTARHLGHISWLVCHSLTQLNPTLRSNCANLYLFLCGLKQAKTAAEEWAAPIAANAAKFRVGDFYILTRGRGNKKGKILFDKRDLSYDNLSE